MNLHAKIIFTILAFATICLGSNDAFGKTGILMAHYGTRNDASRHATIDYLDSIVISAFPQCEVVEGYAAASVVTALNKRGIHKLNISQAIDKLSSLGCDTIAIQSTMLLDGNMTDIIKSKVAQKKHLFKAISIGRPLLYSVDDCRKMTEMIARNLSSQRKLNADKAQVVLVGHGSDSPANAIYSQIDYLLADEGKPNWHVGTIEGYPTIESTMRRLSESKNRDVILVPLLYIAGNHLRDDIDGVWRTTLQNAGYNVSVVKCGLGEMPEIQQLILEKIKKLLK